jgi:hypothetical protein
MAAVGGLALVLAGPFLPAAAAETSRRLPSSRPAHLVDASGKTVGRVMDALPAGEVTVWFQAATADLLLRASPDRLSAVLTVEVAFESSDCSGAPFLFVPPGFPDFFLFSLAGLGLAGEVFVPDGPPAPRTLASTVDTVSSACQSVPPTLLSVRPAVQALDLDDYQAPFTLR